MPLRSTFALGLALLSLGFSIAGAQQKFTTQIMVVPAFAGNERGVGGRASDVVRGKVAAAFARSELKVVSGGEIDDWLRLSGFEENSVLSEGELKDLAK